MTDSTRRGTGLPLFLKPRGEWSHDQKYTERDLVSYVGSSWMARVPSQGVVPASGDSWQLIAAKGDPGESGRAGDSVKGDRGSKGDKGERGATGNPGDRGYAGPQGSVADLVSIFSQPSCANDDEAAIIGVPQGHMYHNGSQLMIRMK